MLLSASGGASSDNFSGGRRYTGCMGSGPASAVRNGTWVTGGSTKPNSISPLSSPGCAASNAAGSIAASAKIATATQRPNRRQVVAAAEKALPRRLVDQITASPRLSRLKSPAPRAHRGTIATVVPRAPSRWTVPEDSIGPNLPVVQ